MALRFNPPPNWPTPPVGFIPQPGWQPDPAWGPAPEGWQFWIEDKEDETTRVLPTSEAFEESADSEVAPTEEPVTVEPSSAESKTADAAPVEHRNPAVDTPVQAEEPVVAPTEETAGNQGAASLPGTQSEPAPTSEDPTEVFAAEPTVPPRPYAAESASTQQSPKPSYQGQQNQGDSLPPFPPTAQNQQPQPPEKKSNKVLWFVLGFVFIFILIIALILGLARGFYRSLAEADSRSSSSEISQSQVNTDNLGKGNSNADGSDFTRTTKGGDSKTYEGSGAKTIDIEKPDGKGTTAWVEYTYKPANKYDSLDIEGLSADNNTSGKIATSYGDMEGTITGSSFIDGYKAVAETTKLKIDGEGDWKIIVHSLEEAPVLEPGDSISGQASQAFIIDARDDTRATLKLEDGNDAGAHFSLDLMPDGLTDYGGFKTTLLSSDYPGLNTAVNLPSGKHLYQAESWTELAWEISLD